MGPRINFLVPDSELFSQPPREEPSMCPWTGLAPLLSRRLRSIPRNSTDQFLRGITAISPLHQTAAHTLFPVPAKPLKDSLGTTLINFYFY